MCTLPGIPVESFYDTMNHHSQCMKHIGVQRHLLVSFSPLSCVGMFCNWQTTKCVQRHLAASFSNEYFYLSNSLPRNQTNAPIAILQKLSHAIWGEHLKTHSGENSNNCTNCNFPSFEGISLRRHMNMHNGGKPHKCNHCSYTNTRHAICESI